MTALQRLGFGAGMFPDARSWVQLEMKISALLRILPSGHCSLLPATIGLADQGRVDGAAAEFMLGVLLLLD
jgi:hypothetical protein